MKKFMLLFAVMITFGSSAQTIIYKESRIDRDGILVPTVQVTLEPAVDNMVERFEDWFKENYTVDLIGKNALSANKYMLSIDRVKVREISERRVDMNVYVDESKINVTRMDVFSSFGFDVWITPLDYPAEYVALNSLVFNFVRDSFPEYNQDSASAESKD
ncbi:MAG: hypothetical protein AAGA77_24540 [Bacteroidota bacterium]